MKVCYNNLISKSERSIIIWQRKRKLETTAPKKAAIDKGRQGGTRTKSLNRLIADAKLPSAELLKVMALGDEEDIKAELNKIIAEKAAKATEG